MLEDTEGMNCTSESTMNGRRTMLHSDGCLEARELELDLEY